MVDGRRQLDLVLRKDGKWFLQVTVDGPDRRKTPPTSFVRVDPRGENHCHGQRRPSNRTVRTTETHRL
ncbi:hypothetical protein MPNT_50128 [Candidatus Methylacidithermus pantelleriae]|uniref:Uncharacterized protein n=1 Tax=Candidatus Methylacidithermus pantelleriae TaxID=2744239 RepID=A0A8J2FTI6_9BACT|nr:hypothetical protein MPNT_50128 [Candidatus Methylacidithermus pantelleriae]